MTPAFLVIDKPEGITSHDVVAAVRAVTGVKKVGHTGTLDPFATGVLPLALGTATRLIEYLDESLKIYDATIQLGSATDTGDHTGQVVREAPIPPLDAAAIERVLTRFVGPQEQRPPIYSAVKIAGRPMYSYARKGEYVEAAPRPIEIYDLQLVEHRGDRLRLVIHCSRGTYARVLADDIATALGSAGHLVALSRTRSGPFAIEDALSMQGLADCVSAEPGRPWPEVLMTRRKGAAERVPWRRRDEVAAALRPWLRRPIDCLAHLPLQDVSDAVAGRVRSGGPPPPPPAGTPIGGRYLVVRGDELIAVGEHAPSGPSMAKVLPPSA